MCSQLTIILAFQNCGDFFLLFCLLVQQRREEIETIIEELFKQDPNPEHYTFWGKTTQFLVEGN